MNPEVRAALNPLEGCTHHQFDLMWTNALVTGQLDDPVREEFFRDTIERLNETERSLKVFLKYLKETYGPQLVYYPMSGWHITPRQVFGTEKVVYLSLDECHPHLVESHPLRIMFLMQFLFVV